MTPFTWLATVTIPGEPVAKARPRFGTGPARLDTTGIPVWVRDPVVYTPAKTVAWEEGAALIIRATVPRCNQVVLRASAALCVSINFYFPRPKRRPASVGLGWWRNGDPYPHTATPDLDNLVKAVLDAATKADIWQDDRVVASVVAAKWVCGTDSSPRTEFRVGYIGGAHE